ncbi:tRNA (guanine-N(1)-)-methyltransferase [Agaricicola taiwanensis]|uniref:tRNA (guanine-N(1)-)-methyltransferase n=1 Tax=Agaricicola taiwanensis TaxID=591372 RepID=A0A8J2VKH9_9RHOB|nr:tRNA (guanosine(37)-N1)-methyltransferase TrmD [Agaricicola taiwanensis]GGE30096.1 tRNA (guanine-N(1)-)-methyltransferase [Agaricicola taiwanensis]
MSFRASVLSLYPEMFPGHLGHSLAGDALRKGLWSLEARNIRDHGIGKHRAVDDTPFGGGPGMVLRPDVLSAALQGAAPTGDLRPKLVMTPRGRPISQALVRRWAAGPGLVILCGRFEGIDERAVEAHALEEVSVGDVVLAGGEAAALLLLDAVVRLLPGVMGTEASGEDESFESGLLEHPQYTRPADWEGISVPAVLTSGDHKAIFRWRQLMARAATRIRRPDLWAKYVAEAMGAIDKGDKIT